ncbi:Membrane-bound lytic murein transglycosylase D precursor, partial [hydrothermal vent metagenome]
MFNNRTFLVGGVVLLGFIIWVSLPKSPKEAVLPKSVKTSQSIVKGKDIVPLAEVSSQDENAEQLYQNAIALRKDRNFTQAKNLFQRILSEYPDFEQVEMIVGELESLNMEVIFSNANVSQAILHEVVSGDTLGKLAKKYHTTIDLIKIKNKLKSNVIRIGQKLRIWNSDFNIYVDKSQ